MAMPVRGRIADAKATLGLVIAIAIAVAWLGSTQLAIGKKKKSRRAVWTNRSEPCMR